MRIWFLRRFPTALIPFSGWTGDLAFASPNAGRFWRGTALRAFSDRIRELYIIAFGLFGPESVFASEATKAGQILRTRLQPDAQLRVRFNSKPGGDATSALLAAALRSAGQAMDPAKVGKREVRSSPNDLKAHARQ